MLIVKIVSLGQKWRRNNDPDNSPILEFGNYYDIIVDNNIIFSFDVDLTSHDECPVFLSSMDKSLSETDYSYSETS